eukprot:TRINITY_DN553_c0_g1_i1.p1 TRINITY_DN553_c0_g1~~TRINITY_DN553_c0_g1_i1.p1  ORF type:complete len:841 (+),score=320.44 TRINITY_DN553_c0_g1_i1:90-2525(+)
MPGGQTSRQQRKDSRKSKRKRQTKAEKARGRDAGAEAAAKLSEQVDALDISHAQSLAEFKELPLSAPTRRGLQDGKYVCMTKVQQLAVPVALKSQDVLCAAKTGSGKTLGFVVPTLEALYRARWGTADGLGALILTPTRELAQQIFKVVTVVGKHHQLTGGIVTGGFTFEEEQRAVGIVNLLVATPGRLMQHADQTDTLDFSTVKVLVLDEADRLLDEGFEQDLDNILKMLPKTRQTMLFSATQTKDLNVLGRLCLNEPEYLSVHAESRSVTPRKLCQNYLVVNAREKLSVVYSFVRRHPREKTIVFLATCSQVKFVYLAMSKLLKKSGSCMMCLTGKMKPHQRQEVHSAFLQKSAACLFCTDVAARGLDFPAVKWVIQADCPDDVETYIHRVGRTARAGANGASLLLLSESEQRFLARLAAKKVRLREVEVNPKSMNNVTSQLVALVVQDPEQKANAQKAVVAYLRSVYFQKDREVFDVSKVDAAALSASVGLARAPSLKFVEKGSRDLKNMSWELQHLQKERERQMRRDAPEKLPVQQTRAEKKRKSGHMGLIQEHQQRLAADDDDSSDGDLLFRAVQDSAEAAGGRPDLRDDDGDGDVAEQMLSKRALRNLRKNPLKMPDTVRPEITIFHDSDDSDDDGGGAPTDALASQAPKTAAGGTKLTPFEAAMRALKAKGGDDVAVREAEVDRSTLDSAARTYKDTLREAVREGDVVDKQRERERVKEKHRKRKERLRQLRGDDVAMSDDDDGGAVELASYDGEGSSSGGSSDESSGEAEGYSDEEEMQPDAKRRRTESQEEAALALMKRFRS